MRLSERTSRWFARLVLPAAVGGACAYCADMFVAKTWLQTIELRLHQESARRSAIRVDDRIRLVAVTDDSPKRLGLPTAQDRIPRSLYADLLRGLDEAGARVALIDVFFEEEGVPNEDRSLRSALRELRSLRVTLATRYDDAGPVQTPRGFVGRYLPEALYEPKAMPRVALGGSYPLRDEEGVLMGAPAILAGADGTPRLHAAFQAAIQSLDADDQPWKMSRDGRRLSVVNAEWRLNGNHALVVEWPGSTKAIPQIEITRALADLADPARRLDYRGRIVVVGSLRGEGDTWESGRYGPVRGAVFLANMLNDALQPDSLRIVALHDVPYFLASGLLSMVAFSLGFARRALVSLVGIGAVASLGWTLSLVVQRTLGLSCERLAPTLGILLAGVLGLLASQSRLFREDHRAPGSVEEATVLFLDVRGSTRLLHTLGVSAYRTLAEALLDEGGKVVVGHGGVVERTLGDGFMAIFRPGRSRHHALRAADAAADLVGASARLAEREATDLAVGVGFETGMVSGGFVDEGGHRVWSSAGETVNLAKRLQASSEALGASVVVGPIARRLLGAEWSVRFLGLIEAKGFDEPIEANVLDL